MSRPQPKSARFLAVLGVCWGVGSPAQEPRKEVVTRSAPSVCGETLAVAVQQIKLAELKCETGVFYIAPDKWRPDIVGGVVYLQAPRAKAIVLPTDAVAVWTFRKAAADQKVVEMPDLTGLTADDAGKKLADLGLGVTTPTEAADAPGGKVADQYPKPKQPVYAGTAAFLRYR